MASSFKEWICEKFSKHHTSRNQLVSAMFPRDLLAGADKLWLEAGCGDGELLELRKDFKGFAVGSEVDPAPLMVAARRRELPNRAFLCFDLERPIPFKDGRFDCVTASGVLNYIDRVPQLIEEVHRVLKPGGVFIFEIPNFAVLYRRWDAMMGRIPSTSGYDTFRGGVKTQFTARMIETELIGAFNDRLGRGRGFEILERRTAGLFARVRDCWPTVLGAEFAYALKKRS